MNIDVDALVNNCINGNRPAFVTIEGEVPPLTAGFAAHNAKCALE